MHPRFFSGKQQDAAEFLLWLLGTLDEFAHTFQFTVLVAHPCGSKLTHCRTDKDTTLRIGTIESHLPYSVSLGRLMPKWAGRIDPCNDCDKQFLDWKFADHPEVLFIQLPRFTEGSTKDDRMIAFPLNLVGRWSEFQYQLKAVVSHYGSSVSHGHYKAFVDRDSGWFECDDSSVRRVQFGDVIVSHQCSSFEPLLTSVHDENAYALLYSRMEELDTQQTIEFAAMQSDPDADSNSSISTQTFPDDVADDPVDDALELPIAIGDEKQPSGSLNDDEFLNIDDKINAVYIDAGNEKQPSASFSDDEFLNIDDKINAVYIDAGNEKQLSASFNDENDATKLKTAFNELKTAFDRVTLGWAESDYHVDSAYQVRMDKLEAKLAQSSETLSQEERTAAESDMAEFREEAKIFARTIDKTEPLLRKILPAHAFEDWVELFNSFNGNAPEEETELGPSAETDDDTGSDA